MIDRQIEEMECDQIQMIDNKPCLNTYCTVRHANSTTSPQLNQAEGFPEPLDLSIDCQLYANNAAFIEQGFFSYLRKCLLSDFKNDDVLWNGLLFSFPSFSDLQNEGDGELQVLVYGNKLLNESKRKCLLQNFREYHELACLLGEIKSLLGTGLAQEITYVIAAILEGKMGQFKQLMATKSFQDLIPKFDRFFWEEDLKFACGGEFKTFEDISYEEVSKFAVDEVERLATQLYFSKELKYISLKEIRGEIKSNINIVDKFASLIILISRNVFLTLAGISQNEKDMKQFEGELSINTSEEDVVMGCDLVKKVKR